MKTLTFDFVNAKIIYFQDDGTGNPVTKEIEQDKFSQFETALYNHAEQEYASMNN